MTKRPRRNHNSAFKVKVALATIRGEKTLVELSQQFNMHANKIKQWRDQLHLTFCNTRRRHSSLTDRRRIRRYFNVLKPTMVAA